MTQGKFKDRLQRIWWDIEYYIWNKPKHFFYDVKYYIKNRITFDKILREWRPWDYAYQVDLFTFGIEQLCDLIEKDGIEETVSRMKKVAAMKELIKELKRDVEDEVYSKQDESFWHRDLEETENGSWKIKESSKEHKKIMKQMELEIKNEKHKRFQKILKIIEGQDSNLITKQINELKKQIPQEDLKKQEENGFYDLYTQVFDGTGIETWWD